VRRSLRTHSFVALALVCAASLIQGCQSGGPQRRGIRAFHVTDTRGYVEFESRQREREQNSKVGAGDVRSEESLFEEKLNLEFDGYGYHPNFLEFTLGATFGLLQHEFDDLFSERRRSSGDAGSILEFDAEAHFLKKKSYPGSVFARRHRTIEPRRFLSSIETTTTNLGFNWQYISDRTPTNLRFSHTDVKLEPLGDVEEDGRQKNTLLRFETSYRVSHSNVFGLIYEYQSVEQQPFQLEYDSDELTLSHRLDFGARKQYRLDSELNFFEQRGSFDIERARWRELLRIQHAERLRSWYRFEVLDRTQGSFTGVPPIEERSWLLSGTMEHELYGSLLSQFHGFVGSQDFESSGIIDRWGTQASFDYRKKNPWGVLLANYRARYEEEDRSGGGVTAEVLDESHTFRDPARVRLTGENIATSSIFITGEDGFTVFQNGIDYVIRRLGDAVEIERVPTGRIADGDTILVDYTFRLFGQFARETRTHDFSVRQDFDFGLLPYYRLRWQDQTITGRGAEAAVAEDVTAHTGGLEFQRRPFRLLAEYEDHDSNINPFRAVRLSADLTHRFKTGATASVKGRWSRFEHQEPVARRTRLFTLEGLYRHPLTTHLTFEGTAIYRDESDSLSGDDEGVDADLSLEWIIRQTEVKMTYEIGRIEDDFARSDYSALFVQIRRRF
jgi:hypothetical protein